eukprot:1148597-Pelagomonas_calceolata.AAC.8
MYMYLQNLRFSSAVRYENRKAMAQTRMRIKGQFAKSVDTEVRWQEQWHVQSSLCLWLCPQCLILSLLPECVCISIGGCCWKLMRVQYARWKTSLKALS